MKEATRTVTIECESRHHAKVTDALSELGLSFGTVETTVGPRMSTIRFQTTSPEGVLGLGLLKLIGAGIRIE